MGRLGDDSELFITVVFGCCLAFEPKNWVQKKNYLIQETVCSVSKFLSVLILYFSFFFFICHVCWLFKGILHPKMKDSKTNR